MNGTPYLSYPYHDRGSAPEMQPNTSSFFNDSSESSPNSTPELISSRRKNRPQDGSLADLRRMRHCFRASKSLKEPSRAVTNRQLCLANSLSWCLTSSFLACSIRLDAVSKTTMRSSTSSELELIFRECEDCLKLNCGAVEEELGKEKML